MFLLYVPSHKHTLTPVPGLCVCFSPFMSFHPGFQHVAEHVDDNIRLELERAKLEIDGLRRDFQASALPFCTMRLHNKQQFN